MSEPHDDASRICDRLDVLSDQIGEAVGVLERIAEAVEKLAGEPTEEEK